MPNLSRMKIADLKELAKTKGVEGSEDMKVTQLVKVLTAIEKKDEKARIKDEKEKAKAAEAAGEEGAELKPPGEEGDTGNTSGDAQDTGDTTGAGEETDTRPSPVTAGITEARVPLGGKAEKMRAHLAAQRKISILIPLEGGEPFGATKSVILNGYQMCIKKNVYVEVPEQVAEVIRDSLNQEVAAIEENPTRLRGGEKELQ